MYQDSFRMREQSQTEADYTKHQQPKKVNMNSFLISYGGGNAKSVIGEVQKDFRWLVKNKDLSDLPTTFNKMQNLHDKYKNVFEDWKVFLTDAKKTYTQVKQWTEPIQDLFKKNKSVVEKEQQFIQQKNKNKTSSRRAVKNQWGLHKGSKSREQEESEDDDDDDDDEDQRKLLNSNVFCSQNPYLKTLMHHINSKVQLCVYFPAVLTVQLLSVNKIDHKNQIAWISLRIQLKISLPQKIKPENDLHKHLKKMKISFNSKKMKQKKQNYVKGGDKKQSEALLQGSSNGIEDLVIWYDALEYFKQNYDLSAKDQETKAFLEKVKAFKGVICSAQMKNVEAKIDSYMWNSPFEMIDLNGSLRLDQITTSITEWKDQIFRSLQDKLSISPSIVIKFNLINLNREQKYNHNLIRTQQEVSINDYKIASNFLRAEIGHAQKNPLKLKHSYFAGWKWKKDKDRGDDSDDSDDSSDDDDSQNKKLHEKEHLSDTKGHFCSHETLYFHFPMYRNPMRPLGAIYPPIMGLSATNLLLFFQDYHSQVDPNAPDIAILKYLNDTQLANRLSNIALVFISFIGTIAILKSQMNKPQISIAQILIYLLILTPVLCVAFTMESFLDGTSEISDPLKSPWFWISVLISFVNLVYPLFMILLYFCQWRPKLIQFVKSLNQNVIFPGGMAIKSSFDKSRGNLSPDKIPKVNQTIDSRQSKNQQKQSNQEDAEAPKKSNLVKTKKMKPILEIPTQFNNKGWRYLLTNFAQNNLKESLDSASFRDKLENIVKIFPEMCDHLKQIEIKKKTNQKVLNR